MTLTREEYRAVLQPLKSDPDKLIENILNLWEDNQLLEERNQEQAEAIKKLTKRVEELERASHRQAAPFRINEDKRSKKPGKPGQKPGHKGHYRKCDPSRITEHIEVALPHCPQCKGHLSYVRSIEQTIEEIPKVQPRVVRLRTYSGECSRCGQVHSTHPLQVGLATGAAGVHLGPNALALVVKLQHCYGMTKRKTTQVLEELFSIRVTPGALVGIAHRAAKKLKPAYEGLLEKVKGADVVHADETSWYVGRPGYWLWVFGNKMLTVFKVANSRGRAVIHEMVGKTFEGVLVSDCLNIYDDASAVQHKCYAHHLKAMSKAMEKHQDQGQGFLNELRLLLIAAMALKQSIEQIGKKQYEKCCRNLEKKADRLIIPPRPDPIEEKIANRLRKQRDHLFTFLYHQQVDATNNLAERQLRPAVIARKVSCGNRTENGARTWEILASLAATCQQNYISFDQMVANAMRFSTDQA